ncbi:hypothetical protein [Paenibacillus sp. BIC5C1]|uniref:hypothetical protein n=1 Tax=Paenibacillus sp. BIC5C1 TaxID=3078263 RepID=UPI0028EC8421|nr:hypothetical protein [Paenibacillus sp. BIC5C1]
MRYMNEALSVEDVKLMTPEQLANFHERILWGDPEPGEKYYDFETEEVHTLISTDGDNDKFALVYEGGQSPNADKCFPLMTIGNLIDTLSFENNLEIRNWGGGWFVIFEGTIWETEERNGLPRLLFDALRHKLTEGVYL